MNRILDWAKSHPRLTAWIVLGLGMNAIVAYEARSVGLAAGQWVALVIATTFVAGLCVWIIGWEDDEAEESATPPKPADQAGESKK
jgi:protein-S-isoprenylcysteine O-methyltransferase Ste14